MLEEHNIIDYNIANEGYNWEMLGHILEKKGFTGFKYNINRAIFNYIQDNYDLSWNGYKKLMDIKI